MILRYFSYAYFSSSSDIDKIHAGIGDKFAILIQWLATFLAGFVIGFVREWRMTLFLIAVTPFLAVVTAIFSKVIENPTSLFLYLSSSANTVFR